MPARGATTKAVLDFAGDLQAHGGKPQQIEYICQDMSAAYTKGVGLALPNPKINYDHFHGGRHGQQGHE